MKKIWRLIILLAAILLISCSTSLPKDEELKAGFYAQEANFVELKNMIAKLNIPSEQEDFKTTTVGIDKVGDFWLISGEWRCNEDSEDKKYTQAEMLKIVGLSIETYQKYLSLLKLINAERISKDELSGNTSISFMMKCTGITDNGGCKSIVFAEKLPEPIVSSTDQQLNTGTFDGLCYVKLKENWFIELDWSK
ncbi:MAG: hypothetical protein FD167_4480 [bacterium]|nr:MAG: hypothetical protein FD167_4480 [bacterium]